jgi:hypothetical protein
MSLAKGLGYVPIMVSISETRHYHKRKRRSQCHKETEQGQRAKALEKVEAWDKAAGAAVAAVLVETVSAQTAVRGCPIGRETLALRKNAPSVVRQ